ncbi:PhzF family phenazine biosynthesis isomerase [Saccharibacter sp. 17.LH.SD]|uniref:PhzF family phenazine biosynthesis protein n=1 Tax=Saccharibacter sp. 17.LH.SD TaxID=2689393 RepID=UPI00136C632B|nr:PhzF family phenazine biosynthesis protein [Saccharibacter sp. 17.LH.SD]MXV44375.1 PhzF family phenazine biosynthesis isomerase [Saccharibacter sp. 17.LH.SD]
MPQLPFFTVDVFTKTRFGGNPLAVVMGDSSLDEATMRAIAAEFNLSETTFVFPPEDPSHTARIRIFNRKIEMAFAGHPLIGTAFMLAMKEPTLSEMFFEIPSGCVPIRIERDHGGLPLSVELETPKPLSLGESFSAEIIANVLGLNDRDIVTSRHLPVLASNGRAYVMAEITHDALGRCLPDHEAFKAALAARPQDNNDFAVHVYAKEGHTLHTRMFAPLTGTWEDPATGGANVSLACLLLSLEPTADKAHFIIHQGIEMGRPSRMDIEAVRSSKGITALLRGSCVPVMSGTLTL